MYFLIVAVYLITSAMSLPITLSPDDIKSFKVEQYKLDFSGNLTMSIIDQPERKQRSERIVLSNVAYKFLEKAPRFCVSETQNRFSDEESSDDDRCKIDMDPMNEMQSTISNIIQSNKDDPELHLNLLVFAADQILKRLVVWPDGNNYHRPIPSNGITPEEKIQYAIRVNLPEIIEFTSYYEGYSDALVNNARTLLEKLVGKLDTDGQKILDFYMKLIEEKEVIGDLKEMSKNSFPRIKTVWSVLEARNFLRKALGPNEDIIFDVNIRTDLYTKANC